MGIHSLLGIQSPDTSLARVTTAVGKEKGRGEEERAEDRSGARAGPVEPAKQQEGEAGPWEEGSWGGVARAGCLPQQLSSTWESCEVSTDSPSRKISQLAAASTATLADDSQSRWLSTTTVAPLSPSLGRTQ